MVQEKHNMDTILQQAIGQSDIMSIDYKGVDDATQENIEFRRVRGSVRLMVGKIKTPKDVAIMIKRFFALRIP